MPLPRSAANRSTVGAIVVSLTALDQTSRDYFNPNNAFDAQGLTKLTEEIEMRRKQRNIIERLINRLKNFRRIATRYEKRAANYLAMITIGAILLWL